MHPQSHSPPIHTRSSSGQDRGLSTVFGTVLVLGIVIVMFGLLSFALLAVPGDLQSPAPNAVFTTEYVADGEGNTNYRPYLIVTHEAGYISDGGAVFILDDSGNRIAWEDVWTGGPSVHSPEFVHIDGFDSDGVLDPICAAGQRYRVVWVGETGDSYVLATHTVSSDPVFRHSEITTACSA